MMNYIDSRTDSLKKSVAFMRNMHAMQKEGTLCDVTLKVSGCEFKAHRVVLATACPYFYTMFTNHMMETNSKEIELFNINPSTFDLLLRFFYTQRIEIDDNNVLDLFETSHYYLLNGIKQNCVRYLKHWLTIANVLDVFRLANLFSVDDLVHECCSFMHDNASSIMKTTEFYEVSKEFVINGINRCNKLTVCEKTKYIETYLSWMRKNTANNWLIKTTIKLIITDVQSNPQKEILESITSSELWDILLKEVAENQPRVAIRENISKTNPSGESTEDVDEYQKCIQVMQKFRIKKQTTQVIGVAWFENKIYILNEHRRIFVVADKAPFNNAVGEIRFNNIIDPTDMVVCEVNRCMYISNGWGGSVYKIKLTNNPTFSSTRLGNVGRGLVNRLSVTPSAKLLLVMTDCCSDAWYIKETDSDNAELTNLFDLPSDIREVDHAVKVPSGNVIMSYETLRFDTSLYLISEVSVPGQNFLWEIDIRSTALPRLLQWFSSQLFVREDGEIFFAGVSGDGKDYRNHIFLVNQADKELKELVSAKQDRGHPIVFSFGQDRHQLVICRAEGAHIFTCISRSPF